MIKAIAIDLDGTLLNSNFEVSDENANALKKAVDNGIQIIIATGRNEFSALSQLGNVKSFHGFSFIFQNGSIIYKDYENDEKIVNHIPKEHVNRLFNAFDEDDLYFFIFDNYFKSKKIFVKNVNENNRCLKRYFEEKRDRVEVIHENKIDYDILEIATIDQRKKVFKLKEKLEKMNLKGLKYTTTKAIYDKSDDYWIEVLNEKATKSYALEIICKELGFKIDEIAAIGDNHNDHCMLEKSGFAIAMHNAVDEIKEIADFITLSNVDHGVAHAIDEIIKMNSY